MSDGGTTLKGALRVGVGKWLGILGLIVYGGITSYGVFNVQTRSTSSASHPLLGTNTGFVIQVNGVTVSARDVIPLTNSGGNARNNLAVARLKDYGITGTGVLFSAAISWVKAPSGGTSDIVISKCRSGAKLSASSGTIFPGGDNMLNMTGTYIGTSGTGTRVNGEDCIAVKSLTTSTSTLSGYLIINAAEDPSE